MINIRKILLVIVIGYSAISSMAAQTSTDDEDSYAKNMASLSFGLTYYTWNIGASYTYKPLSFLGIGIATGYWKQFLDDGFPCGKDWNISEDDRNVSNIYARPNIVVETPKLFKVRDCAFLLYLNPGCTFNIPYADAYIEKSTADRNIHENIKVSTNKGKWIWPDLGIGIVCRTIDFQIFGRYYISTMDIFSMYRKLSYQGVSFDQFYPSPKIEHGVTIGFSYLF